MSNLGTGKLRLWLAVFFLALAIPTSVLIYQAYRQLKWEAFYQHRLLAEELAARIDDRFEEVIGAEEARPFTEYVFLNVVGDPAASFVQRSPLSVYPLNNPFPGLIGHFQVDSSGAFSTPLLPAAETDPASYGISGADLDGRRALATRMRQILSDNRLVDANEAIPRDDAAQKLPEIQAESQDLVAGTERELSESIEFDRLTRFRDQEKKTMSAQTRKNLGRVEDLKLDQRYQSEPGPEEQATKSKSVASAPIQRSVRKEQSALPELRSADESGGRPVPIRTFESEVDRFEFSVLDSGHFVLFRKVWRDGNRYIQGLLIERQPFLQQMIQTRFTETALSAMSDLVVAFQGDVYEVFRGDASRIYASRAAELQGTLLYQTPLSAPFGDLELVFSVKRLPPGPGAPVVYWMAVILAIVLSGGFYLMYRLGVGGIRLARQQQDFVSAVSHELKTPLTSIRMYGEMLREGWAPEQKKQAYYEFIHDESERLSRLINNVLQLSRMARRGPQIDLRPVAVSVLMDEVTSKVSSQVERAGFELNVDCAEQADGTVVMVDKDYFTQILINLVDNAVKFSAKAECRIVDVSCRLVQNGSVRFSVRDYGPGIPRDQVKKIFVLFFRSENELTRETVGTGIGLALVDQLAKAMGARVDVVNRDPGAEFSLIFDKSE